MDRLENGSRIISFTKKSNKGRTEGRPESNTAEFSDATRQSPDGNIYTRLVFLNPFPLLVARVADGDRELTGPVDLFWR